MEFPSHQGDIPIPITSSHNFTHDNPHDIHKISFRGKKDGLLVKYKECLKNHAATIGVNATDGCGEFMPSGEDGTLEALKCSACSCHRNFHRKEIEGETSSCDCSHGFKGHKRLLISGPSPHSMIMPFGAIQASEPFVKKRFRTKFTQEQKEKMLEFAERVGWKLQKVEDSVVHKFCIEIGVKRRVLKVWMHNNKQNLAKKDPLQSDY